MMSNQHLPPGSTAIKHHLVVKSDLDGTKFEMFKKKTGFD